MAWAVSSCSYCKAGGRARSAGKGVCRVEETFLECRRLRCPNSVTGLPEGLLYLLLGSRKGF